MKKLGVTACLTIFAVGCTVATTDSQMKNLSSETHSALCQMAFPAIDEARGDPPPLPGQPATKKNWPRTPEEIDEIKSSLAFSSFNGEPLMCVDDPLPGEVAYATRAYFNSDYLTRYAVDTSRNLGAVTATSAYGRMALGASATCIFERSPVTKRWALSGCTDYIVM